MTEVWSSRSLSDRVPRLSAASDSAVSARAGSARPLASASSVISVSVSGPAGAGAPSAGTARAVRRAVARPRAPGRAATAL